MAGNLTLAQANVANGAAVEGAQSVIRVATCICREVLCTGKECRRCLLQVETNPEDELCCMRLTELQSLVWRFGGDDDEAEY